MKRTFKIVITIIFILLSYGFIYLKIKDFILENKGIISSNEKLISSYWFLFLALALMPLNWFVESIKWNSLIHKVQDLSLKKALVAIFSGITIGIFTPNRVGEIGGRLYFISKENRIYATFATWVGSFAQFITTILFGTISLLFYLNYYNYDLIKPITLFVNTILILLLPFILWLYFNLGVLKKMTLRIKLLNKLHQHISDIGEISKKLLLKVLILSLLRFIVFTTQYYLILHFFNIGLNFFIAFVFISVIYLVTTLIPTTTIAELGIRTSIAVYLIGMLSPNSVGIILSSFSLWIINLALPAFIGSFFLLKNKF